MRSGKGAMPNNYNSIFEVIGPIMVGPSSSHTAGAARLSLMARAILGEEPVHADIALHGSFAETGQGHGTERALIAGLLGMAPSDPGIRVAMQLASDKGLTFTFDKVDLGKDAHPNSARLRIRGKSGREVRVVGCSIGGGNIIITEVDGYPTRMTGQFHTLLTVHEDQPGVIAGITAALAAHKVNIAFMRVERRDIRDLAFMTLEVDDPIPAECVAAAEALPGIKMVRASPVLE